MSGNMSFLNDSSGNRGAASSSSTFSGGDQGQGHNGSRGSGPRGSITFRDGSSSSKLSSFVEEDEEPKLEMEGLDDQDAWGNRIILSALADIAFSEMPHPKLSPDVIQGLQKFLLSVDIASSACNPFVEYEKSMNSTLECEEVGASFSSSGNKSGGKGCGGGVPKIELPTELMEGLTPECKVVLRSLIGSYVRKQVVKIREFWKPILEMNGTKVPELPDASSMASIMQRRSVGNKASGSRGEGGEVKELFGVILNQAKVFKDKSEELDEEIKELLEKRREEMKKYERDVNTYKELVLENLKEQKAQENPEFVKKYAEYLDLETERINQQIRLEKLKIAEEEQGTEEEQKERRELYTQVKEKFDTMSKETEEMKERLEKYKSLGPKYLELVEEYKAVDEEVKLKEWVLEQLENGPKDDSLLNDSC